MQIEKFSYGTASIQSNGVELLYVNLHGWRRV
jgi:hypothetical protein